MVNLEHSIYTFEKQPLFLAIYTAAKIYCIEELTNTW